MLLEFKTNINCGSCVRSVTNFLDEVPGISFWRVNTEDPRKLLQVEGKMTQDAVMQVVQNAGFEIEPILEETAS